jgi:hypothetical protein
VISLNNLTPLTKENLEEFGWYIADIINMDWTFKFHITNKEVMKEIAGDAGCYAVWASNDNFKIATIYVNGEKEYCDDETWELSVIHEMIHVVYADLDLYLRSQYKELNDNKFYEALKERMVEHFAKSLYELVKDKS